MENVTINKIAHIETKFKEKFGIPRQSGRVKTLSGVIVFEKEFKNPDFFRGLENFSHLWIIFGFDKARNKLPAPTVRPPRLGGNTRTGVFATRSPYRPNNLGLTLAKIERIDYEKCEIFVSGIDILNNSPVYDIKPYIPYADYAPHAKGGFADEFSDYKLTVEYDEKIFSGICKADKETIIACIADDPRPAYKKDGDEVYKMKYGNLDVSFFVKDGIAKITEIIVE